MNHRFVLKPNADILYRLGYIDAIEKQSLLLYQSMQIEAQDVWTEERRLDLESKFTALTTSFNLIDLNDTLLFIALKENDRSVEHFELELQTYEDRLKDKQLAQLLMLYKPTNKFKPSSIKVTTAIKSISITSTDVISWLGVLIEKFLSNGEFIPGLHGSTLFKFMADDNSSVIKDGLNYLVIEEISKAIIRKPDIRTRNKYLAPFLLRIQAILNNFTPLMAAPVTKFSDRQLNFLFRLAEIFNWVDEASIESEPKDYLGTLLNNYLSKHNKLVDREIGKS